MCSSFVVESVRSYTRARGGAAWPTPLYGGTDMMRWILCVTAVAFAMSAMPASGAVVFEVSSTVAGPGSSGNTIEVDALNNGNSSVVIYGFDFTINASSVIDFTDASFSTLLAPYIFAGGSFDQVNSLPLGASTGSSLSAGDISNDTVGILVAGGTLG